MTLLTIGQVAQRAGIRPSAIRYYESLSLLPKVPRQNGQRRYQPDVLDRLAFIQVAQQLGFSLKELHQLLGNAAEESQLATRWQTLASRKLAEVELLLTQAQTMQQLLHQGLRCGCADLSTCLDCVVANCQPIGEKGAGRKRVRMH